MGISLQQSRSNSHYIPYLLSIFFLLVAGLQVNGQDSRLLKQICRQIPDTVFQEVFTHPGKYRLQILYTQINRDARNQPHFTTYRYHVSPGLYFNPASTVKLAVAALALQKLHTLKQFGVDKYTTMLTDSSYPGQTAVLCDSTAPGERPSVAQYIKRIFLVSDNDAYNRLYEFLGQAYINRELHRLGYKDMLITRRFTAMDEQQNRHTNGIRFLDKQGHLVYYQKPAFNTDSIDYGPTIRIGKAYMNSKDRLIQGPWDFTRGNHVSLDNLNTMAAHIMFPSAKADQSGGGTKELGLDQDDLHFLWQYMSQFPGETNYPKYDSTVFFNSFTKFYFRHGSHQLPEGVREFNKPGWSYGFLTDIGYVADFKHQVEFMLSCTLYVNSDGIINDNRYDYDNIGFPFLYALGQGIYQYELKRPRKYKPDLSALKIRYEQRRKQDNRPLLKIVDD